MIEVRDVTKRFGTTVALDRISFSVGRGEVLGFLGPNGAGKSTAMKIITTFLAPDAGTAKVAGIDVLEQPLAVRGKIGYLPENVPLYLDMSVQEYLTFVGRARGLAGARLRERLDWCVEACGLRAELKKPVQDLSKGYRQRTGLAQALIHDPEILILDEPTSGLDPLQILGIRDLVRSLAGQKTIIFSTHILQEVRPVTDRVVIINEGRIIADGVIGELARRAMGNDRVHAGFRVEPGPAGRTAEPREVESALRDLRGVAEVVRLHGHERAAAASGHRAGAAGREAGREAAQLVAAPAANTGLLRFEVRGASGPDLAAGVARLAVERGWMLAELHEEPFTLEDTFISLTRQTRSKEAVR